MYLYEQGVSCPVFSKTILNNANLMKSRWTAKKRRCTKWEFRTSEATIIITVVIIYIQFLIGLH